MSILQQRIGDVLRDWRTESQEAVAERLGMHRTYYSAIERGEKNLTLATIERIVALYPRRTVVDLFSQAHNWSSR